MKSILRRRGKKKIIGDIDVMVFGRAIKISLALFLISSAAQRALAQQPDLDWGELSDEVDQLRTLTDQQLTEESQRIHRSLEDMFDGQLKLMMLSDLAVGVAGFLLYFKSVQKGVRVGQVAGYGLTALSIVLFVLHTRQHADQIESLHQQAQKFGEVVPPIQRELEVLLKKLLDYLSRVQVYLEIPVIYHPDGGFKMVWHPSTTDLPPVIYDTPTYLYQSHQYAGREWVKKYIAVPEEHLAAFRSLLFLKLLESVSDDDAFAQNCAKRYYDGCLVDATVVKDLVKQAVNQSIRLDRVLLIGLSVLPEFESLDLKFAPDVFPEDARWVNYRLSISDLIKTIDASSLDRPLPVLIPITVQ